MLFMALCLENFCEHINVILLLQILCLLKRYVDVKKCYGKNNIIFIKKEKKQPNNF